MIIAFLKNAPLYKKLIALGLLIVGCMLLLTFIGVAVAALFWRSDVSNMLNHAENINKLSNIPLLKFLQAFSAVGTFIVPVLIYALITEGKVFSALKMNQRISLRSAFFVLLLTISVVPFINILVTLNSYLQLPAFLSGVETWMRNSEDSAAVLSQSFLQVKDVGGWMANILVIALIPALGEEMLFRGVIQNMLSSSMRNKHLAIWISAAIFSAIHMQFFGFLPRMVLGLVLGYLFFWSGSLLLSMLAHFLNNAFAVTLAYLSTIQSIPQETGDVGSSAGEWLVVLLSIGVSSILLWQIYKFEKKRKLKNLFTEFEVLS